MSHQASSSMPWPWKDMERVCSRWRECGVKCYDECDTSRISVDHGRTGTTQPPPSRRPGSLPAIDLRIHPCSWFRTLRLRRLGIQSHSSTGTKPGACVSRGGLVTAPPASMTSFRAHLPPVCCSAVQAAAPVLLPVRMTVPVTVLVALTDPRVPCIAYHIACTQLPNTVCADHKMYVVSTSASTLLSSSSQRTFPCRAQKRSFHLIIHPTTW